MTDFFKDKVFHNTSLKVFSIIFALVFWIYVMDQVNPVITRTFGNVKVDLLNASTVEDNELVIKNNQEFFVDVTVEGRRDEVLQFNSSDLSLTADLMGYRSGINTIPINVKSNNNDVKIINQSLEEIKIEFENYIERSKPINLTYEGKLPENYVLETSRLAFKEAFVRGAASKVNSVETLAASYNIEGLKNSISEDITIAPVDSNGDIVQGVSLGKKYVTLSLTIAKEKQVPVVVEFDDQTSDDYHVRSYDYTPKTLKIKGEESLVDAVKELKFGPFEIKDALDVFSLEEELVLPVGITIVDGSPRISIFGEVEPILTKEYVYNIDNITIINIENEDYTAEIIDENSEVTLSITEPESSIDSLAADDIILLIDGSDFELGENEGRIFARFNNKSYDYELSQETLTILIEEKNGDQNLESEGN
jgi:YbbR domain-containing protein